ncbi:MAG: rhomboid family intramembrane serine protease [Pirellulales bacterium]
MLPYDDHNPTERPAIVTWGLIALNVVVFLLGLRLDDAQLFELQTQRGFIPSRIEQLRDPEKVVYVEAEELARFGDVVVALPRMLALPADPRAIYLSLITCQFLHGGWMHLIGNMLYLMVFGNNVEDRFGHAGFLIFYLAGGIFASICHWAIDPSSDVPTIGASGAVAAVLGAYIVAWPHARIKTLIPLAIIFIPLELPAFVVLGFWFGGQVLDALRMWTVELGGGVAIWRISAGFCSARC